MSQIWLYSILSVVIVSLLSFVGAFTLSININKLRKILLYFISFAAGALLGGAFLHLLPESMEVCGTARQIAVWILVGLILFFALEKILKWRHCHEPTCEEHPHSLGMMNLVGDGFHNLIDGMIIAVSYLVSIPLGIATTVAVILHEIPQEIGDFGILIYAGYSREKALLYNFLSALMAVFGAVITLLIGGRIENLTSYLIPLTIGGFIYIATADLIPELHKEVKIKQSSLQLFFFLLGIGLMALLLLMGAE